MHEKLQQDFFLRPTLQVAEELLGKLIVMNSSNGTMIGEINEVVAYIGQDDAACHAASGKSKRNEVMYLEGGHAYVYFTYGMYHCLNFVTEKADFPAAVLIRSVIPVKGEELMMKNRAKINLKGLTDGPGKLCLAMGIDRNHNGLNIAESGLLYVVNGGKRINKFEKTPRIGITKATDVLWRFAY